MIWTWEWRPSISRLLVGLSALLILGGAVGILVGALSPWANVRVFHSVDLSLSGLLFAGGELCLAAALLVLLGMRRSALLCLIAALFVLRWTADARSDVPHRIKHQVVGAQLALSPLNRLFDQFHITDVDVADWNTPNAQLLAPGLDWTADGALALLIGSLLGLPSDPVARWVYVHTARARCRACGARWPLSRRARFCPSCGVSTVPQDKNHCPACGAKIFPHDHHCVQCGHALPAT